MKKQLLTIALLITGMVVMAQNAIVNGGFENWSSISYDNPTNYWTSNDNEIGNRIMSPNATQAKSPDSYTGAYSVRLETVLSGNDTVPAYFYNGDPGSGSGGIPIGGAPTSLVGYYKGTIMPGDTAIVLVMCKQMGVMVSFDVVKLTASQANFTQFTLPINLFPMSTPDTVIIAASCSNALESEGVPGSVVYFDSFEFTGLSQQPSMLNGDFELWYNTQIADLDEWHMSGVDGNYNPQSIDAHSGMYSVMLETSYSSEQNQAYGSQIVSGPWNGSSYDGKPFTNQIDTLVGWYKYLPQGVDSGRVSLNFYKNGAPLTNVETYLVSNANYAMFSLPFNTGMAPDTVVVYVSSSSSNTAVSNVGTVLKIDDLYFKSQIPTVTESSIDVTCNGADDAAIDITVSGGTSPFQFAWSNGASTEDISGLAPDTYTVTVTDSVGAQVVYNVTVSEPTVLSVVINPNDANCSQNDGDATATPSGGTMPYTYSWTNGPTTASYTGLAAGVYNILITDANGCTVADFTSVANINGPSISATSTDLDCNGDNSGSVTASALGGTGALTYSWSQGGNTTNMATGLAAGTYIVEVMDQTNCVAFAQAVVAEPAVLDVQPGLQFDPSCYGWTDGQLSGMVTGGTQLASPPYYNFMFSNGVTADVAVNLGAGTHTITVTDANGCIDSVTATLNQPNVLMGAIDSIFHVTTCADDSLGRVYLSATGGNGNYSYYWPATMNSKSFDTTLVAGTYDVIVNDPPYGCIDTIQVTINAPAPIILSVDSVYDALCYGTADGMAYVSSMGGTGTYTYLWSNGNITDSDQALAADSYTVTVTDANGCTNEDVFTINEPNELVATAGSMNDSAYVNVAGGTAPYLYSWYQGGNSTNYATGLSNGTYTVSVMDTNGCVDSDSTTIVISGITGVASNNISVYPNPSNGVFFINSNITNNKAPVNVTIRNVIGEVVFSRSESQLPNIYKVNVGATLPAGMYTIELQSGETKYMTKIFFE